MNVLHTIFTVVTTVAIFYYLIHHLIFGSVIVRAAFHVGRQQRWEDEQAHALTFSNPLAPGISVLIPAHNEEAGIVASVTSLVEAHYPHVEIIVVDDGSKDATVERLHEAFDLYEAELPVTEPRVGQVGRVLKTYASRKAPGLKVLSKTSVGRRSDAINAAFRRSTQPLVCMIDGDSILEPDALLRVAQPFVDDPSVVAAGGVVLPSNGSKVERGRVTDARVPRTWLERTQVLEYLRAFLVGRSGWSASNGLMIISGAFGIFRREVMAEVGGLDEESLAEDAELVVAVHRAHRRRREDYRVVFVAEPVCWSETPSTAKVLARQRRRWSHGLGQMLSQHRDMIGRPRYGRLGVVTMPYFLLFELWGPVVELLGLSTAVLGVAVGWVDPWLFLLFVAVSFLLSIAVSLAALLVEVIAFGRYQRVSDTLRLALAAVFEPFWFRPIHAIWRIRGLVASIRGERAVWGEMTRKGFADGQ
ncbi:glycosyltransferase family 2 protein [Demequina activiva]|uniref:Glycosyl transferase family 2 n=1 Tax=Demequina activiva TaxID=1582364 RepID=A0A919Q7L5_9MICO|nr:glycosyltransferase [Demequina activiva]GIG55250.1 glycosyl transferase family 2 [Demequina activiva]